MNDHICPLCNFQVLNIKIGNNPFYEICPNCYTNHREVFEKYNIETSSSTFLPCFACTNNGCYLKTKDLSIPIFKCSKCVSGMMAVKTTKFSNQFIGCTNYPNCFESDQIPSSVIDVKYN